MRFVTDFLWRSPLGLRINAQDTAGVAQTEDWVRIARRSARAARRRLRRPHHRRAVGDALLRSRVADGRRSSAPDTEVFVDERFSAVAAAGARRPCGAGAAARCASARDDERRATSPTSVAARDGRSVAGFAKGAYQGIAREHFVEFDLPEGGGADRVLVAQGWIYPTDSSINVAIGAGQRRAAERPGARSAGSAAAGGSWTRTSASRRARTRRCSSTCARLAGATRLRLRTNLEIYWDRLAVAERASERAADRRGSPRRRAELRYRGFSQTTSPRGDAPETPRTTIGSPTSSQRWRDLRATTRASVT